MAEFIIKTWPGEPTKSIYTEMTHHEATQFARDLGYAMASDGIWMPRCDIRQYENRLTSNTILAAASW